MLFKNAGVNVVMLPSRGESDAITNLMSGFADFYFGNTSIMLQYAQHEAIRLLAVATAERIPAAPWLPTVAESVPGFVFSSWNGYFVPRGTPEDIIDKLRADIAEMMSAPDMRQRLAALGHRSGRPD